MRATGPSYGTPGRGPILPREVGAAELARWIYDRVEDFEEAWSEELRDRAPRADPVVDPVLDRFVSRLVRMLPLLVGPDRDAVQPIWDRACELFGVMALRRGLSAGEVIEEFHLLRELVIRALYSEPPLGGAAPLSLREILRLNRVLDRGVTHASVGHTDALFFEYLEHGGEAPPASGSAALVEEIGAQLESIGRELVEALEPDTHDGSNGP